MSTPNKPTIKRRTTTEPRPTPDMAAAFPDRTRPQVKNTSFNLPIELHERLRVLAFQQNTTMKDLIVEAVEKAYPAS
ncbi:hypothetical protein I6H91_08755 [Micrococcus luteus]|uniref:hypothetical protein n=1 Tax=Micrococcus luteus TaxID=1270 RepID=UPI0019110929|nr:hypothetical protein [Micrococcus luteus]QQE48231.1 hypothetical protein I6H91_08755 [Micrococcus luteus]